MIVLKIGPSSSAFEKILTFVHTIVAETRCEWSLRPVYKGLLGLWFAMKTKKSNFLGFDEIDVRHSASA